MEKFKPEKNIERKEEKDSKIQSRRKFIKKIAVLAAGMAAAPESLFVKENREINERELWKEIEESVEKLKDRFGLQPDEFAMVVNPERQELYLVLDDKIVKRYTISTGKTGIGSRSGSGKTPPGAHRIKQKFGENAEIGTIFVARRNTGRKAEIFEEKVDTPEDYITTRIMWLDGQEEELNRGGRNDSHSRYIYIHGTQAEGLLGQPASKGCIRMGNEDVVELFDTVPLGTLIEIQNKSFEKDKVLLDD